MSGSISGHPFFVRKATDQDAAACVVILRHWIMEMPWLPMLHSEASMNTFWTKKIVESNAWVAESAGKVIGFLTCHNQQIDALYVAAGYRNIGIGRALLDQVQSECASLSLWAFQANSSARAFYAHMGFVEVRRTDGDNAEGLPDVLLQWERRV